MVQLKHNLSVKIHHTYYDGIFPGLTLTTRKRAWSHLKHFYMYWVSSLCWMNHIL